MDLKVLVILNSNLLLMSGPAIGPPHVITLITRSSMSKPTPLFDHIEGVSKTTPVYLGRMVVGLGLMGLLVGCAGVQEVFPKHTLIFNIDGVPCKTTLQALNSADKYDTAVKVNGISDGNLQEMKPDEYDRYLKDIFDGYDAWAQKTFGSSDAGRLAISIHGGLPDYDDTLKGEQRLIEDRKIGNEAYLIGINWSAGAWDGIWDHYARIANGMRIDVDRGSKYGSQSGMSDGRELDALRFPLATRIILPPLRIAGDLLIGTAKVPETVWYHLDAVGNSQEWWNDNLGEEISTKIDRLEGQIEEGCNKGELRDPNSHPIILLGGTGDNQGFIAQEYNWLLGIWSVPWVAVEGALLREAGAGAYYMMQRHIQRLFVLDEADNGFHYYQDKGNETYFDLPGIGDGPMGVFLRRLGEFQQTHPHVKIELYAHSMGTMVADGLISRAHAVLKDPLNKIDGTNPQVGLHFDRITYMAGADSIRNWQQSVWPYLQANSDGDYEDGQNKTIFYNVMLNYLSENREQHWVAFWPKASWWYGWIPFVRWSPIPLLSRGSLLVWIDNYLTTERDRLDRTLGRSYNMLYYVNSIPWTMRDQIRFRSFASSSSDCEGDADCTQLPTWEDPQTHGEAGDIPFWEPDYYQGLDPDCDKLSARVSSKSKQKK
jgi:hypothetical protein